MSEQCAQCRELLTKNDTPCFQLLHAPPPAKINTCRGQSQPADEEEHHFVCVACFGILQAKRGCVASFPCPKCHQKVIGHTCWISVVQPLAPLFMQGNGNNHHPCFSDPGPSKPGDNNTAQQQNCFTSNNTLPPLVHPGIGWKRRIQELKAFQYRFGHMDPSQSHKFAHSQAEISLASWLSQKRQAFQKGTMLPAAVNALQEMNCPGFEANTSSDYYCPTTCSHKRQRVMESVRTTVITTPHPAHPTNSPTNTNPPKYKIGTEIAKAFPGYKEPFQGTVQNYDWDAGFYQIVYEDGDKEDMTEPQVTACLAQASSSTDKEEARHNDNDSPQTTNRPEVATPQECPSAAVPPVESTREDTTERPEEATPWQSPSAAAPPEESTREDTTERQGTANPKNNSEKVEAPNHCSQTIHPPKYGNDTEIFKSFPGYKKLFLGKVQRYDKTTGFYKIVYEDGDREDMTEQQVTYYLAKSKGKDKAEPPQSNSAAPPIPSATDGKEPSSAREESTTPLQCASGAPPIPSNTGKKPIESNEEAVPLQCNSIAPPNASSPIQPATQPAPPILLNSRFAPPIPYYARYAPPIPYHTRFAPPLQYNARFAPPMHPNARFSPPMQYNIRKEPSSPEKEACAGDDNIRKEPSSPEKEACAGDDWMRTFEELKRFGYPHPRWGWLNSAQENKLANWLTKQHTLYRKGGQLSDEQVRLLRDLRCKGFADCQVQTNSKITPRRPIFADMAWNRKYHELQVYKAQYGHANPQLSFVIADVRSDELCRWLSKQRSDFEQGMLSLNKVQRLHHLGCSGFDHSTYQDHKSGCVI